MKDCKSKNCKHYKKDERIGIKVCEYGLHESYCEKDKEDYAIEELEKMKKRINQLSLGKWYVGRLDNKSEEVASMEEINFVFDKRISELKGENKLTCDRNICLKNEYSNIGCEDCVVTKGEQK